MPLNTKWIPSEPEHADAQVLAPLGAIVRLVNFSNVSACLCAKRFSKVPSENHSASNLSLSDAHARAAFSSMLASRCKALCRRIAFCNNMAAESRPKATKLTWAKADGRDELCYFLVLKLLQMNTHASLLTTAQRAKLVKY